MALIRTKSEYDYSTYDSRALHHNGCIVDVGCAGWDMFASLVGKKRIIGIDPFEVAKDGYEFVHGIISPVCGEVNITFNKDESTITGKKGNMVATSYSWKQFYNQFCNNFGSEDISILKLNIEGAEYPLLNSMDEDDFDKIDQIMVSFHDWINPKWRHLTFASIQLLMANGYHRAHIASQYGWNLFIKQ